MHFSYLLAIVGLTGAAIAAPAPDAEPSMSSSLPLNV